MARSAPPSPSRRGRGAAADKKGPCAPGPKSPRRGISRDSRSEPLFATAFRPNSSDRLYLARPSGLRQSFDLFGSGNRHPEPESRIHCPPHSYFGARQTGQVEPRAFKRFGLPRGDDRGESAAATEVEPDAVATCSDP